MCKVYDVINNKIIELLQQGTVPWRKTWHSESNYPKNLISKKEYRGANVFLLACQEYSSPYWVTFKQCQDKGCHVRKGEKSTPVVFWKWVDRKNANDTDEQDAMNGKVPLLRYYNVFNLDQIEGVTAPPSLETTTNPFSPIQRAQEIIAGMPLPPDIRHGGNKACYSGTLDYVKLPTPESFESPEEYYSTAFHELIHSTGHASRVGRKGILEPSYFGSHEYSKEELVAEMGAAFLCGCAGVEQKTLENSAAYIAGWLKALKNDRTLLVHAAAQAQHASDYILNRKDGDQAKDSAVVFSYPQLSSPMQLQSMV
ncbi:ArdC family protein [Geomonas edaphica]|uniref:ArdC family protein n=1 Tax=Geomonas edaphica TaxID=2570226 RepID=UPI0010A79B60|nr:zincin-like metallopeptidase domain-containing protein [Geomonas edaphica]